LFLALDGENDTLYGGAGSNDTARLNIERDAGDSIPLNDIEILS
jgi:hypothetical protein